jgi:hypothetical protein
MRIVFDISDKLAQVLACSSLVTRQLDRIEEKIDKVMATQEEFDEQIAAANVALDEIATAIAAETAQIEAYIAANPGVDTSALAGVVARLEGVNENISAVFEPPAEAPPAEPEG